jgi:hypothetical protein
MIFPDMLKIEIAAKAAPTKTAPTAHEREVENV